MGGERLGAKHSIDPGSMLNTSGPLTAPNFLGAALEVSKYHQGGTGSLGSTDQCREGHMPSPWHFGLVGRKPLRTILRVAPP